MPRAPPCKNPRTSQRSPGPALQNAAPDKGIVVPDKGIVIPDRRILIPDTGIVVPDQAIAVPDTLASRPRRVECRSYNPTREIAMADITFHNTNASQEKWTTIAADVEPTTPGAPLSVITGEALDISFFMLPFEAFSLEAPSTDGPLLVSIEFFVGDGGEAFDLWIDDLAFVCPSLCSQ